ncbi:hypothetical protein POM88_050206 [Heracleum sosnowskyi]|uniref:Uncharacterized protein n=1 Tax=Heracleum sosnowskyi TaxID=360622 RepID=A0AAD8GZN8_9APIA|nr:hypothetical protein POM88_050206 [Heracleum sosnowskyi]
MYVIAQISKAGLTCGPISYGSHSLQLSAARRTCVLILPSPRGYCSLPVRLRLKKTWSHLFYEGLHHLSQYIQSSAAFLEANSFSLHFWKLTLLLADEASDLSHY